MCPSLTDNPSPADHLKDHLNGHASVTARHSLPLKAVLGAWQLAHSELTETDARPWARV